MAKILILNGSPRAKGNTHAMIEAFTTSAMAKGHTVETVDCTKLKVHGCHACMTCYSKGKACNFNEDFNTVAPKILDADAIVFAAPVYWYSIPAQIKGVIDCIFSLVVGEQAYAGKKCALITCCEEHDATVMDCVRIPIQRSAALLKWEMVGSVEIPGVFNVGDIDNTDGCAQAATLAEKF